MADGRSPASLAQGDDPSFQWDDMSRQTGISYQRSQVKMSDITDGASNTFLIGEKYINSDHYTDGKDLGDSETMYCGDDMDLLRWTGSTARWAPPRDNNLPVQDRPTLIVGPGSERCNGSAASTPSDFNMSFCDGSVAHDQLLDRRRGLPPPGEPQRRPAHRRQPVLTA